MSDGDESLEKKFQRILGDDGVPGTGDEPEEPVEEEHIGWREKRHRERVARQEREDNELKNLNEYWYIDPNIDLKKIIKQDAPFEELEEALLQNRVELETLKRTYCRSKKRQYDTITSTYMHEIKRHVNAIEVIKDIMAARALDYRVYYTDREHPIESCRRIILDCFIASTLYGPEAHQTNVLRLYRDVRLSTHPLGRLFIRVYYKFLGRAVSKLLRRFKFLKKTAYFIVDRVIGYVEHTL